MTMDVFSTELAKSVYKDKYQWLQNGERCWADTTLRVTQSVIGEERSEFVSGVWASMSTRTFIPGGRQLYAAGRPFHQVNNCFLLSVEDTKEGWAELGWKVESALLTGGGIGVEYSNLRPAGNELLRSGGVASGPLAKMQAINDASRHIVQGGQRRPALWAGLHWKHGDIFDFIRIKDWGPDVLNAKSKDFTWPAPMDVTNVSVRLDPEFLEAYHDSSHPWHTHAVQVFDTATLYQCTNGEPGFTFDNDNQILRNACTESISADDSDVCCLGSINLANVENIEHLREVVYYATRFLIHSTIYSDVPYQKVATVRDQNRRIGLGLMGIHEWLLQRGYRYGMNDDLRSWLSKFSSYSREFADFHADALGVARPIAVNAIAPTGTLAILAETTGSIEPIFCAAYKRRHHSQQGYGQGNGVHWQEKTMLDPVAERLIAAGVDVNAIEDSYSLSKDVERRIKFQADVQEYIDQGISSTVNLPMWNSSHNNVDTLPGYRAALIRHIGRLRGITVYPNGARAGQPITPVSISEVINQQGGTHTGFVGGSFCDTVCG